MKTTNYGNCLLIYGGGLCDPANLFMRRMAEKLTKIKLFEKVHVGFYSFEAMLNENFIREWDSELRTEAEDALGGFFGTCRDVNLTDPELQAKAISILKKYNIQWVFVGGGDGSARQCAEIAKAFEAEKIKIGFLMPMTIDGIEGGKSFGLRPAVNASCRIIEQLVSTCLNTRANFKAPGLIVELQGRNRDDILANVVKHIVREEVNLGKNAPAVFAIPANYPWNKEELIRQVNTPEWEQIPVLILLSEGANIKRKVMKEFFHRKMRTFEVAHLSQMNGMTDEIDALDMENMLHNASIPMRKAIMKGKSFSLVYHRRGIEIRGIDYYSVLNPREGQHPTLSKTLENTLDFFIP